jgi:hypothetical protein
MEGDREQPQSAFQQQNVEEIVYNNITVEKRRMINRHGNDILNGIGLTLDISFGNYQIPIKKNSYMISEDDLIYLCGKHIVSFNLIRKRQNFIIKNPDDESVTCMNYYYGRRGSSARVAVGLKSNLAANTTLAMIRVYYANSSFIYNLSHGHLSDLSTDLNIVNCCFFHKGKWLAS